MLKNSHTLSYCRIAFFNNFFLLLTVHIYCTCGTDKCTDKTRTVYVQPLKRLSIKRQYLQSVHRTASCPHSDQTVAKLPASRQTLSRAHTGPTLYVRHSVTSLPVDQHVSTSNAHTLLAIAVKKKKSESHKKQRVGGLGVGTQSDIINNLLWPVAARPKALVCRRSLAGIAGSNPTTWGAWMSVCCECCVLCRYRSLRRADPSYKGVLPTAVSECDQVQK